MPNTEQLLYQTEKRSHCRFSIKTMFLKILQYSWENTYMKFLRTPILNNIHSVHWGINPTSKHHPLFFANSPLES